MYAWYICHNLVGAEMEAELLIELLTSWTVVLWGSPDSFDSVRGLGRRCNSWLDKATLYFRCQGRGVLLIRRERSMFPLTIITPRGPGILSLR